MRTCWASREKTVALDEFKQYFVHNFNEDPRGIAWEVSLKVDRLKGKYG